MHQLNSVVSEIFCHVPSRLVHSFKHAPEITGPTAVATVVMRHSDNCATGDGSSFCTHRSFNWSNVKSLPATIFFLVNSDHSICFRHGADLQINANGNKLM